PDDDLRPLAAALLLVCGAAGVRRLPARALHPGPAQPLRAAARGGALLAAGGGALLLRRARRLGAGRQALPEYGVMIDVTDLQKSFLVHKRSGRGPLAV